MDIVRCIQTVVGIIQVPINLVQAHKIQNTQLWNGLEEIKNHLELMMNGDMATYEELMLRELAYDVEDFAQRLWIPRASGPILSAFAMNPVPEYLEKIKHFKDRIDKLNKRQSSPGKDEGGSGDTSGSKSLSSASGGPRYAPVADLVGIAEPKMKLLELLKPAEGEEAGKLLKVISIVRSPGVGKTALARAVFDHIVKEGCSMDFDCVVWVVASGCDNKTALVDKVVEAVGAKGDGTAGSQDLHGFLANKRYLVVIDDVLQAKEWKDTVHDFPETGKSSRLIVTTRVHSVANVCSSGSYVYRMQCLPQSESEDLLRRKVYDCRMYPAGKALPKGSESIISKCDGLPLGLVTVGDRMSLIQKNLDTKECVRLAEQLGSHLVAGKKGEDIYRELRISLEQWYDSLHEYDHKTCMLSLSTFPMGHPIKRKGLARRLICEGLVSNDGHEGSDEMIRLVNHAQSCLDELTNRCIVEPVQICRNSKDVKSCQVKGLMLEFIIRKSQSTNMVTLIREKDVLRNTKGGRIRRLSVQSSTKDKVDEVAKNNMLPDTIRSLTIIPSSKSKRDELFEMKDCKFLRLLDLEGCRGLDKLLDGIYELDYLKYLSLRKTDVKKISPNIKNLQCLQTLDIRDTTEMELPIEVIMLPKLAFLFGQFLLPVMSKDTKDFLSTTSQLHTLAGFVVGEVLGFEQIILEARNLKKVKVWCRDTSPPKKSQKFAWSLKVKKFLKQKFSNPSPAAPLQIESTNIPSVPSNAHAFSPSTPPASTSNLHGPQQSTNNDFVMCLQKHFTTLDSVSIHSSQLSQDILASLEKGPCAVTCLKLWGQLRKLPEIATLGNLNSLSRLQLSYTGLSSEDLSILQHISCLEYLMLLDNRSDSWSGSFVVDKGGFENLQRLCFQASKLPKLQFHMESTNKLTSLVLLCPQISQVNVAMEIGESISHITSLNELILHGCATKEIVQTWEKATNGNTNRPFVKRQQH